jgi:hypothetical protein
MTAPLPLPQAGAEPVAPATKEWEALSAFILAMKDCNLDGARMREAMLFATGPAPALPEGWLETAMGLADELVGAAARESIEACKGGFDKARAALRQHLSLALPQEPT